ncbi:Alpha--1 [Diplonema papillatum]|nr:Alpha--1 [Diplonema papillatum]
MPKIRSSAAAAAGAVLLLVLGGLVGKKDHEQQSTPLPAAAAHLERSERHDPQPVEPAQAPTPGPKRAEWPLWIDEQWKHAPAATRENITAEIARRPCAGGFFERYTTPLDPSIPFEPDEAALRAQFLLHAHQFCGACGSVIYRQTKPYQGLGSRFHMHMCGLDQGLMHHRPFLNLDGGWIFANGDRCPAENDQCYFSEITACPKRFCRGPPAAKDCPPFKVRPLNASEAPGANCLRGACGSTAEGKHELIWKKFSCEASRRVPVEVGGGRSHLWWTSQLVFYLMQPAAALRTLIELDLADPFFDEPVVNLHIRRGEKVKEMPRLYELPEYIAAAKGVSRGMFPSGRVRYFVQTNEPSVIDEVRRQTDGVWNYTAWTRTGRDLLAHNDPKKWRRRLARGLLVDAEKWTLHSLRNLWLMLRSDAWVCTFSSNWCRVALRLAYATYGTLRPVASLDPWSYDPYTWYDNAYVQRRIDEELANRTRT